MKITDVQTLRLRAPIPAEGQVFSRSGVRRTRSTTLLRVETDEGIWGIGSASAINARGDLLVWVNGPNLYWAPLGLFSLSSLVAGPNAELTAWKSAVTIAAHDINDPDINTGFGEVMGSITFSNGAKSHYTLTPMP